MIQVIVTLTYCCLFQVDSSNQFIEKFAFIVNQYMQALGGIVPIFNYMVSLFSYEKEMTFRFSFCDEALS